MASDGVYEVLAAWSAVGAVEARSSWSVHRGFSGAVVYRVPTETGVFALRRWANPRLNVARLQGLHRLLAWVHGCGLVQIPVPLRNTGGQTVVRLGGHFWQLEPWMPGQADFRDNPSRERLRNVMDILARWHRAAQTFPARSNARTWFRCESAVPSPTVSKRLSRIHDWQHGRLEQARRRLQVRPSDSGGLPAEVLSLLCTILDCFTQLADETAAELRSVRDIPFRLQPCLRDIRHDHVLLTGDEVTGLIDPAACRTANIAADLARLLGSLLGDDTAAWRFALECYSQQNPLSDDERALAGILGRSGVLLSGMTWVERLLLRRETVPDWPAVIRRIRLLGRRLERLCEVV